MGTKAPPGTDNFGGQHKRESRAGGRSRKTGAGLLLSAHPLGVGTRHRSARSWMDVFCWVLTSSSSSSSFFAVIIPAMYSLCTPRIGSLLGGPGLLLILCYIVEVASAIVLQRRR